MDIKLRYLYNEAIMSMFSFVPDRDGWRRPEKPVLANQMYKGRKQWVVGYAHSRVYANPYTGLVYDRILGHGETPQAAIDMMRKKLQALQDKKERQHGA